MSHTIMKRLLRGSLVAATSVLALPAVAAADAPDVTSVSTSVSGTTLSISGTWAWSSHHSDCNHPHSGVGFAVDWNDPAAPGNNVTTIGGDPIDVGTPADNVVHDTSGGSGPFNCGTFDAGLGYNTGSFGGLSHTYSGATPSSICVVMYDTHGSPDAPTAKDVTAGGADHNTDNSDQENLDSPEANRCATVVFPSPPPPAETTAPSSNPPAPAIALTKVGPASANAGADVPFTLTVTNPGNEPLTGVAVSDPRCDASAPARQSATGPTGAGDATPASLDPGDSWVYTCAAHTAATDATIANVATVTGTDPAGTAVNATATATVPLLRTSVEPLLPGTSRLSGPSGCVSSSRHLVLRVAGKRIASVTYYLDGRRLGTRIGVSSGSGFVLTVPIRVSRKLRSGSHAVRAVVTYRSRTSPKKKTLRLVFARCAVRVRPKFTG